MTPIETSNVFSIEGVEKLFVGTNGNL